MTFDPAGRQGDMTADPWSEGQCDAPGGASYINTLNGSTVCRCLICARCGHHTGNAHQGHYWKGCASLRARLAVDQSIKLSMADYWEATSRDRFHFCCPGDCELDADA